MRDKVLVIGGYGQVGKVICNSLADVLPGRVIAAGRSLENAKRYTSRTMGKIIPMQLDIYNVDVSDKIFEEIYIVVMCLDQKNTRFVKKCIQNAVHYIDISPSYNTLAQIEVLDLQAKENKSTIVLGVGLAPGLSNLLVKQSKSYFDAINSVDIYLMLGIGERHGKDGVEWLLNYINSEYCIVENNITKRVKSFEDCKMTIFDKKQGLRSTYRFDLADQHIIQKLLKVKSVSSRFCYDSVFLTKVVAVLKKFGFFKLLRFNWIRKLYVIILNSILNIFQKLHIGSDLYSVKIDVHGVRNNNNHSFQATIAGNNNTLMTGSIASIVTRELFSNKYPGGVFYIEELFNLESIVAKLEIDYIYDFYSGEI